MVAALLATERQRPVWLAADSLKRGYMTTDGATPSLEALLMTNRPNCPNCGADSPAGSTWHLLPAMPVADRIGTGCLIARAFRCRALWEPQAY